MFYKLLWMPIAAVFSGVTFCIYFNRRNIKAIAVFLPYALIFGLLIILMFGCTQQTQVGAELQIPEDSPAAEAASTFSPVSSVPILTNDTPPNKENLPPSQFPSPITDTTLTPSADITDNYSLQPTPTPQIIEVPVDVPVEVIREVVVELPGEPIEVIKEVYIDRPLDGIDTRERHLAFINELNAKYADVFSVKIGGGEYCYGFTSRTEYLIGYFFVAADSRIIFSYNFLPLSLYADQETIESIMRELTLRNEE